MKDWAKEVQMVDKGLMLPITFCQKIFGTKENNYEINYS